MPAKAKAEAQPQRRPVICLGDSHTRGFLGASWLALLRPKFPGLQFINAGNDGEPSETILARLPPLLRAHRNPAAVIIFSGSNDCIAQEQQGLQGYYSWRYWLKQPCSQQNALDNAVKMVEMVQQQAPQAKVVVINLPIMVEDPCHTANIRACKYSAALAELMHSKFPSVAMVDFQTACRQYMDQHSSKWVEASQELQQQQLQSAAKAGTNQQEEPVAAADDAAAARAGKGSRGQWAMTNFSTPWNMFWSKCVQNMMLSRGWNDISSKQGLVLLTDQIHMNETAAGILAGLLEPLLQEV